MKWASLKNGVLLAKAENEFDIFITVDRNLSYQQNLSQFDIAVVVLKARTNRLADLRILMPRLLKTIPHVERRHKTIISA